MVLLFVKIPMKNKRFLTIQGVKQLMVSNQKHFKGELKFRLL